MTGYNLGLLTITFSAGKRLVPVVDLTRGLNVQIHRGIEADDYQKQLPLFFFTVTSAVKLRY